MHSNALLENNSFSCSRVFADFSFLSSWKLGKHSSPIHPGRLSKFAPGSNCSKVPVWIFITWNKVTDGSTVHTANCQHWTAMTVFVEEHIKYHWEKRKYFYNFKYLGEGTSNTQKQNGLKIVFMATKIGLLKHEILIHMFAESLDHKGSFFHSF